MKLVTSPAVEINHVATGKQIRELRVKKNISLRRLALTAKMSAPFLSDLELGRRNWKESTLKKVEAALKSL